MVALTLLVWVQTRSGMDVGFGVSAGAMGIGLVSLVAGVFFYRNKPPQGSICTPIAKVRFLYMWQVQTYGIRCRSHRAIS
jgi:dipeptide/tripeptide permease